MNTHRIITGDCIEGMNSLPECSVHTCITSPPYFGLRAYGGGDAEIGQEETVDGYVNKMTEVFRAVRRILRDDGTVWLNLGDSYMAAKNVAPPPQTIGGQRGMPSDFVPPNRRDQHGLKGKDLIGIPWRVALALQADGWYLRQDIIWHKPNPMPESVEDRCTRAHEYIFLLSKKPRYYYDHEAIKEPLAESSIGRAERKKNLIERTGKGTLGKQIKEGVNKDHGYAGLALGRNGKTGYSEDGKRNKRSVWTVNTRGYKGAHFAVYPEDLITPCVLAGTSAHGCCSKCGAPYEREVERMAGHSTVCPKTVASHEARGGKGVPTGTVGKSGGGRMDGYTKTLGWNATCKCNADVKPCVVFDPFTGSGTTAVVALKHGRNYIGTELNPDYVKIAEDRIRESVPQTLDQILNG